MSSELASRERRFSPEEYLTIERGAGVKSEYIGGRIYAMSGGSFNHVHRRVRSRPQIHPLSADPVAAQLRADLPG
jgi:hypothetical protein